MNKQYLIETPNFDQNDLSNLPCEVWIGYDMASHNDLRIKFFDNHKDIPLRMDEKSVKLDKKYKVSDLKMGAKIFYKVCDWFICNRDIINTFFKYSTNSNLNTKDMDKILKQFLQKRDMEITQNPSNYMIPYLKTNVGCTFNTPQTIPINVDMKNMSIHIQQVNEAISDIVKRAGIN